MRKEVNISEDTVGKLQELADKRKWSLKKYMEYVLEKDSKKAIHPLIKKVMSLK